MFVRKVSEELIPKENITCTEYSSFGNDEINTMGIRSESADLRDSSFNGQKGRYDIICMFQVLVYLDPLESFFMTLNNISSENALLFIGVPNNKLRNLYDSVGIRLDVPPIHLTRWNYDCMKYLANIFGWSVCDHKYEPNSVFNNIYHFVISYYQRKLQFSYKIDRISISYLRKAIRLFTLLSILLKYIYLIPLLIKMNLGSSQWFFLRKGISVKKEGENMVKLSFLQPHFF